MEQSKKPALLLLCRSARATGPNPYPGAFASSSDGRWYTIVSRDARFDLVKRRDDLPPRTAPIHPWGSDADTWPVDKPDSTDAVVASGTCGYPQKVVTLRDGRGFLAFEEWGGTGHGRILDRFDGHGALRWSRPLRFFFDEQTLRTFTVSMAGPGWQRSWWVSEDESFAVIVGVPYLNTSPSAG